MRWWAKNDTEVDQEAPPLPPLPVHDELMIEPDIEMGNTPSSDLETSRKTKKRRRRRKKSNLTTQKKRRK